jgi:NADPH:quinone reductase-like Zn-dependent oxidoreductase
MMRLPPLSQTGAPSKVLKLDTNWPKPEASGSKLLVEVHAVSLNRG